MRGSVKVGDCLQPPPGIRDRKPDWLKIRLSTNPAYEEVKGLILAHGLHTVCQEAQCPNTAHCFERRTATFLLLGDTCTRGCRFCAVKSGRPSLPDPEEPERVAEAVKILDLKHVVLTSVTRDDLPDGGAGHFALAVRQIRSRMKAASIEVLIPDFKGSREALRVVVDARPEVVNHNVETVPRLYPEVRPQASYERSLNLLRRVKEEDSRIASKSGLMVGLGETPGEVLGVMEDLRKAGCEILTIGQYLAPSPEHHPVVEFVNPDRFAFYQQEGVARGFSAVSSGPLVRSSFHAGESYREATGAGVT
jgi:lipoic acid synthetase